MLFHRVLSIGLLFAGTAHGAAVDALHEFVKGTRSGKTTFTQTLVGKSGKVSAPLSGSFQFQRPGKFRWVYEKPYEQSIVGDGQKIWIYDKDLNQVSVKKMGAALGQSPAAILAGNDDFENGFAIKELGMKDGLEWLEAVPKTKDTNFESIKLGFRRDSNRSSIASMELMDTFGQTSVLIFGAFDRTPPVSVETFRFAIPKGADVLGEDK